MGILDKLFSVLVPIIVVFICLWLSEYIKVLSRIGVALVAAAFLGTSITLVADNVYLSVLIWFVIMVPVCFALALLPRIHCAFIYMASLTLASFAVGLIVNNIIPVFLTEFERTGLVNFIIWLISVFIAVFSLLEEKPYEDIGKKSLKILDRAVASVINAISLLIPMMTITDNWVFYAIAIVLLTAVMYLVDIFTFARFLKYDPNRVDYDPNRVDYDSSERKHKRIRIPGLRLVGSVIGFAAGGVFSLLGHSSGGLSDHHDSSYGGQEREQELWHFLRARKEDEEEEYERIRKETEEANRYYDEKYGDPY